MNKNKMLWLSIAAAAVLITGTAFAVDATTPPTASAAAAVAEAAKHHHGQRVHKGRHHADTKTNDSEKKTEKKQA